MLFVELDPCPSVLTKTELDDEETPGTNGMTCSGFVVVVLLEIRELFSSATAEALAAATVVGAAEPVIVTIPGFADSIVDTADEGAPSEVKSAFGGTTIVSVACDELVLVLDVMLVVDELGSGGNGAT